MTKEDRFGRFTIGKSDGNRSDQSEEKLIELYRNRAELKKEFQNLRDQRDDLEKQLKKKDEAIKKIKTELTSFEELLTDPASAINVMTFYRLRSVWRDSQSRIKNLAVDMTQKRRTRERQKIAEEFSRKQNKRLEIIEEKKTKLERQLSDINSACEAQRATVANLRGFWNYFKRRETAREILDYEKKQNLLAKKISDTEEQYAAIQAERPNQGNDISIGGKRAVNMVCLAMAQFLYEHYAQHGLYDLICDAVTGKPQAAKYGVRKECDNLMAKVSLAQNSIDNSPGFTEIIRQRTETIRASSQFRTDNDTIPLANSLSSLPAASTAMRAGRMLPKNINLISDDVWNVVDLLLV